MSGLANSTEPVYHLVVFPQSNAEPCPFPLAQLSDDDVVLIWQTALVAADGRAMLAPLRFDARADFMDAVAHITWVLYHVRLRVLGTEDSGDGSDRATSTAQRQETFCFQLQPVGPGEAAIPKVLPEVLTIPPRRKAC